MLEGNLLFVHLSIQTLEGMLEEGNLLFLSSFKYTNDMLEGNLLFVHLSIQTTC